MYDTNKELLMAQHSKRTVKTEHGEITFIKLVDETKTVYQAQFGDEILAIYRLYSWDPRPPKKKPTGYAVYFYTQGHSFPKAPFAFAKNLQEAAEFGHQRVLHAQEAH